MLLLRDTLMYFNTLYGISNLNRTTHPHYFTTPYIVSQLDLFHKRTFSETKGFKFDWDWIIWYTELAGLSCCENVFSIVNRPKINDCESPAPRNSSERSFFNRNWLHKLSHNIFISEQQAVIMNLIKLRSSIKIFSFLLKWFFHRFSLASQNLK